MPKYKVRTQLIWWDVDHPTYYLWEEKRWPKSKMATEEELVGLELGLSDKYNGKVYEVECSNENEIDVALTSYLRQLTGEYVVGTIWKRVL